MSDDALPHGCDYGDEGEGDQPAANRAEATLRVAHATVRTHQVTGYRMAIGDLDWEAYRRWLDTYPSLSYSECGPSALAGVQAFLAAQLATATADDEGEAVGGA